MSTKERKEEATVLLSVCDFCGAEEPMKVIVASVKFDPRSRSSGFTNINLWPEHPHYDKEICGDCIDSRAYLTDTVAPEPPGMLRCSLFDGERREYTVSGDAAEAVLSERPLRDEMDWYGLVLDKTGKRAVVFRRFFGYWQPNMITSELNGWLSYGQDLLVEHSERTPWPTVIHAKSVDDYPELARIRERYGDEIAKRSTCADPDGLISGELVRHGFVEVRLMKAS